MDVCLNAEPGALYHAHHHQPGAAVHAQRVEPHEAHSQGRHGGAARQQRNKHRSSTANGRTSQLAQVGEDGRHRRRRHRQRQLDAKASQSVRLEEAHHDNAHHSGATLHFSANACHDM